MAPSGPARDHPAADLLDDYARQGVPADCGNNWTIERLDLAVEKGAHSSATNPQALHDETMEQIDNPLTFHFHELDNQLKSMHS